MAISREPLSAVFPLSLSLPPSSLSLHLCLLFHRWPLPCCLSLLSHRQRYTAPPNRPIARAISRVFKVYRREAAVSNAFDTSRTQRSFDYAHHRPVILFLSVRFYRASVNPRECTHSSHARNYDRRTNGSPNGEMSRRRVARIKCHLQDRSGQLAGVRNFVACAHALKNANVVRFRPGEKICDTVNLKNRSFFFNSI